MQFHCYFSDGEHENGSTENHHSLGPAGLALHYANIITQIDVIVRSNLLYLLLNDIIHFLSS
jgi:Protein of unknown function (DUF668)